MTDDTKPGKPGLLAFLKGEGAADVCVTGHSLGGALAPTLALYLSDNKTSWSAERTVSISCLPVAGATPGNDKFAAYYETQLGSTTTRVWNKLDVVPHGFEEDMLQQVTTIYPGINCPIWLPLVVNRLIKETQNINYTQLLSDESQTVVFDNGLYAIQTDYLGQALYNHVAAYGVYFNIFDFQILVNDILQLGAPYFTAGTKALKETPLETA